MAHFTDNWQNIKEMENETAKLAILSDGNGFQCVRIKNGFVSPANDVTWSNDCKIKIIVK